MLRVDDSPPNCSLYNPCGRNGCCEDNTYGEWTCECKFWWKGSRCEYQTTSGKQVIALGCLLGVFIIVFYGLAIFYYIRNRKPTEKETNREKSKEPKLFQLTVTNVKQSTVWTTYLIPVIVVIITALALIGKWSFLHSIHNDLAYKFRNNLSLYYDQNSICHIMNGQDYNIFTLPFSCFLTLMFIIRTKRLSLLPKCCHNYGGLAMPVDFFSHIDREFVAVVFASYADELFDIAKSVFVGETKKAEGIMLIYLLRIVDVLIISLRYYPILAAVYFKTIFTLACGTLYTWLDFALTIVNQGLCDTNYYPTADTFNSTGQGNDLEYMFNYFGTGSTLVIIELSTDIPRYMCVAYVCVKLPVMLINRIYRQYKLKNFSINEQIRMNSTREEQVLLRVSDSDSSEMLYVRNLLCSVKQQSSSRHLVCHIIPKVIYEWRDDFHYSSRVLSIYSSISLLLFFIIVEACMIIMPRLEAFRTSLQEFNDDYMEDKVIQNEEDMSKTSRKYRIPDLTRLYSLALGTAVLIIVIQLIVSLVNIRRNLFQLYRGDDCEIPRRKRSNYVSYSVNNVHFAGYFIGYFLWGFFLVTILSVLFYGAIEGFILYGNLRLIETALKYSIPSSLFLYFKMYLNKFLSRYIFLQDAGQVLSINNRRLLMIYIYLSFFLDAFLGVISSIIRLTKSIIGGIFYMCRMDYSPMGRKLESFDGGFNAYCGFIHVECAHRHPIMLVFASDLLYRSKLRQSKSNMLDGLPSRETDSRMEIFNEKKRRSLRAVCKWHLGAFLCRNPAIVFFRKTFLNRLQMEEIRELNDIDDDRNKNLYRRLSTYTRRMSVCQPNIISETDSMPFNKNRF